MPQIRTFCRIKPTSEYYPEFEVSKDTLYLRVPEVLRDFTSPNKSRGSIINHEFHFNYIFNNAATQEEVFDVAAKDIVNGFLNGYNGTIFAYGQTGTGKTFTVEGSPKSYSHRGLEPRCLSMIYKALEERQNEEISVHLSYLEIYQEVGYDLLNPGARTQSVVTPLPKVSVFEGSSGVWIVRNLSVHLAASEDVAQNLLLQGQANRRVAATTVHDRSSRSHAVFTVQLSAKQPDSDVIVKSKLHLVDLAGSERVSKTGVEGHLLSEAKSINLSLHFLETVIISLQGASAPPSRAGSAVSRSLSDLNEGSDANLQRPYTTEGGGRRHVPYRNSLLTMVLRDSLGGNCLTAMIATLSLEIENLGESISTCRFAGRVACIANSVSRNEEVDEKTLIKRLRKRVAELEAELACVRIARESSTLNIDEMNAKLTDEDKILCNKVVKRYIVGDVRDPVTEGITNPYKFRECLKILKRMIIDGNLPLPEQDVPAIKSGYDSDTEVNNDFSRPKHRTPKQPDILKVHGNVPYHREKTVDIPITNAWEAVPEPRPSPPVRKPVHRPKPKQEVIPVIDDANYHTDNEDGRLPTGESQQTAYSDPPQQEKTLSQLLTSKRKKYKSPFEQRRVKEIKKLNNKVEKLQQEQIEKEGELVEMKLDLASQELHMVEEQVRNKLNVTKEQVQDQHAYVMQLQTTEADPKLIEQEKLVEQQLRKRQSRFDKQLEELDERKVQLQQHSEEFAAELSNVPKPSLKDQYGKYRKKDGSLNTRQVFDMLKGREKRQEKVHNEIEHEKAWVFNKQLEMREAATRQKLQQFKEMLRLSKTAGAGGQQREWDSNGMPNTAPANVHINNDENVKKSQEPPPTRHTAKTHFTTVNYNNVPNTRQTVRTQFTDMDSVDDEEMPKTRQTSRTVRTAFTNGDIAAEDVPKTRQTTRTAGTTRTSGDFDFQSVPIKDNNDVFTRPPSSKSIRSVPDPDFYAARRQEKDPTARWESSYSRPSTSCSNRVSAEKGDNNSLVNGNIPMTDDFKSSSRKSERNNEPDVLKIENGYNSETVMPSEYVYGMGRGEKFDGRKMGLASSTFEQALANMLEKENQNVYFDQEDYDQYARTSFVPKTTYDNPYLKTNPYKEKKRENSPPKLQSRPRGRSRERKTLSREQKMWNWSDDEDGYRGNRHQSRSPKRQSRERSRGRSQSWDRSNEEPSALDLWASRRNNKWGPEARGASIHAKLGLQTPEKKTRKPKKKKKASKRTLAENLADYDKKTSKPAEDLFYEEPKVTRIKALPEDQAEATFMSKVQEQKNRISKIRQARASAEVIQRAWRKYLDRKKSK